LKTGTTRLMSGVGFLVMRAALSSGDAAA